MNIMPEQNVSFTIDLRGLQTRGRFRGVGSLWRELLRSLSLIDRKHNYTLLYAAGFDSADDEIEYPDNFRKQTCRVPFFPSSTSAAWLWTLDPFIRSKQLQNEGKTVLIDSTFADLIFPCRPLAGQHSLVWVYDLIPWLCQEDLLKGQRFSKIKKRMLGMKLRNAAHASAIITISESTRRDFHRLTGYPSERIMTIPLGADPEFFEASDGPSPDLRRSLDLPGQYVIFTGALDAHKNLPRALAAYAKARNVLDIPPLLVVGKVASDIKPLNWIRREVARLDLDNHVRFLDWVPKADLVSLYGGAQYLLFPSLYEGFGLPALEAMAAGCPVLTSNTSSLPEVVGDCAVLVDPSDTESITAGMIRMGSDPVLRAQLSLRGAARACEFTWRRTAEAFLSVLKKFESQIQ